MAAVGCSKAAKNSSALVSTTFPPRAVAAFVSMAHRRSMTVR